jgi:uncharacterized protein (TIGR00106 family)
LRADGSVGSIDEGANRQKKKALFRRRMEAGHLRESGRRIATMNVIVDLCIVPIGVGVSLSSYVAACEKVLSEAGLKTVLHANGTNIEGEWDKVFAAVRRCHEVVHEMGAPRVFTVMKVGTRTDRGQTMEEKTESVKTKLASL